MLLAWEYRPWTYLYTQPLLMIERADISIDHCYRFLRSKLLCLHLKEITGQPSWLVH
jgi:hypothetical protein